MSTDKQLRKLSNVLLGLTGVTIVVSLFSFFTLLMTPSAPLILQRGNETFSITIGELPHLVQAAVFTAFALPQLCWIFAVAQVAYLAWNYRKGKIFTTQTLRRFVYIGVGLMAQGIFESLILPAISILLFLCGISPWQADIPFLAIIQPDLIMAGLFFIVLGEIMNRGRELEESEKWTV